jgi:hypothetical protein
MALVFSDKDNVFCFIVQPDISRSVWWWQEGGKKMLPLQRYG